MRANRVLLLYNSFAGDGSFKNNLDVVISRFQQRDMMIVPYKVDTHERMVEMLKTLNRDHFKKVIISGGDGTIDICINALMAVDWQPPLAIFPNGTANDFAHYLSVPKKLDEMIDVALEDRYTYTDVGMINDRYFVNVASLGFLIDVSQKTDPNLKNSIGVLSYYLRGIGELPNMKAVPVRIESAEMNAEVEIFFMLIMNGSSAGGFKRIAPKASVNDGKFDVIVFKKCPVIEIMGLLVEVLQGKHIQSPYVDFFQTEEIKVYCDTNVGTDIDGEKGPDFPLHIKILHNQFKVNTYLNDMLGNLWM